MTRADYDAVRVVWAAAGLDIRPAGRDTAEAIAAQLEHWAATYLVAEVDGQIVGTVLGTHDQRKGWINRLAVQPAYQRRGIAKQLLEACEAALRAQGIEIVAALVDGENPASDAALKSAGLTEWGPIRYYRKVRRPDA